MSLTMSLGLLLAAGFLGGILAARLRVPEVTMYIVMGLMLGPSLLGWIPEEHLHELNPVMQLAMAAVLFDIGSRFPLHSVNRILRPALTLSLGEIAFTFSLVFLGLLLAKEDWRAALMLGGLAISTAPATTILVLREYDSDGPVTSYTYILVALNNLAAIVAFEVFFLIVANPQMGGGPPGAPPAEMDAAMRMLWLAVDLAGSTLIGVAAGMLASFIGARFEEGERTVVVFAAMALSLGICEWLGIPYLLAFLAMGVTVANASPLARDMVDGLQPVTELIYLLFFVAAGAELDVRAMLAAGTIGAVYIAMRTCGKYLGIRFAARLRKEPLPVRRWLGATLIAQAGAAIGLVTLARRRDPDLGAHLQSIIIGTVVFFELVGPLLTGFAVLRSGEVPMAHFVRPSGGWRRALRSVLAQLRMAFGADPWPEKTAASLTVADLMRQNPDAIPINANFEQVLDFVEKSRQHTYPVVDANGSLAGVIVYATIRVTLFHQDEASLIRADDLTEPARLTLHPDQPIDEALRLLERRSHDVIPVVESGESRKLVGLIERRDVVRYIKRKIAR